MTIQDYLRVLRERWVVVVTAVAVALLAAGGDVVRPAARVHRQMRMYVSAQTADSTSAPTRARSSPSSG